MHLPRNVLTFAQAKEIYENSKPIQNRPYTIRPLGRRRDVDTYWVRMGDQARVNQYMRTAEGVAGCVEFMLYKTPVIRYYPSQPNEPQRIEIKSEGWSTPTTHQTIAHVLGHNRIGLSNNRGTTIVEVGGEKAVLRREGSLMLDWRDGELTFVGAEAMMGYRVNRKKMNEVRSRYTEFDKFFRGFVKLRTEQEKGPTGEYNIIKHTVAETAEVLGTAGIGTDETRSFINIEPYRNMMTLPGEKGGATRENEQTYCRSAEKFFALVKNGQGAEKHKNFYKAAMGLFMVGRPYVRVDEDNMERVLRIQDTEALMNWDLVVKKWHRKDYLELIELPKGAVPIGMYDVWMKEGAE